MATALTELCTWDKHNRVSGLSDLIIATLTQVFQIKMEMQTLVIFP